MSVAQERAPGPAALQRRGRFRPGDAILYVVTCAAALTGVVLLALITREVFDRGVARDAEVRARLPDHSGVGRQGQHALRRASRSSSAPSSRRSAPCSSRRRSRSRSRSSSASSRRAGSARWSRLSSSMLAAIPSVVLGLWGILVLGPFITGQARAGAARVARLAPDLQHRADRRRRTCSRRS